MCISVLFIKSHKNKSQKGHDKKTILSNNFDSLQLQINGTNLDKSINWKYVFGGTFFKLWDSYRSYTITYIYNQNLYYMPKIIKLIKAVAMYVF